MTLGIRDLSSDIQSGNKEARALCVEAVFRGLVEYDRVSQREANDMALVLAILDDEEKIVGGLLGKMLRGWLRIDALWVAEDWRRLGHGARLMQRAEEIATAQGCRAAHLDTYSYQAPEFYLKLGYEVFGKLQDYPAGETRYYLKKSLISPAA